MDQVPHTTFPHRLWVQLENKKWVSYEVLPVVRETRRAKAAAINAQMRANERNRQREEGAA